MGIEQASSMVGVYQRTVAQYFNFLKSKLSSPLMKFTKWLESIIVEVDESKFGKSKYHKKYPDKGTWIIGGIERTQKKCDF